MFIVILLTACAGWCVISIAAALVIGAAIERRDADDRAHNASPLPTLTLPHTPPPVALSTQVLDDASL